MVQNTHHKIVEIMLRNSLKNTKIVELLEKFWNSFKITQNMVKLVGISKKFVFTFFQHISMGIQSGILHFYDILNHFCENLHIFDIILSIFTRFSIKFNSFSRTSNNLPLIFGIFESILLMFYRFWEFLEIIM